MKRILFFLMIAFFSAVACQSQDKTNKMASDAKHEVLSVSDFKTRIADGDVQLVDVRTPKEFEEGSIGNALNINYQAEDFAAKIQDLDKNKPVYIFCRSGVRSGKAAKVMEGLGFNKVYDLQGGYLAWPQK
ncbi:MAG: rhodanese-like domain-containing protein [Saprospiraceae bacterium]|nr:rhodanese-like domain-containing protein [Saprospiraceae bacterium]